MSIRLAYNGNNIDLNIDTDGLRMPLAKEVKQRRSFSGKIQTIGKSNFTRPIVFSAEYGLAVHYQLIAFWSWAEQGNVFSFAMDSGNTAGTSLGGSAPAAQKVIPVAATTGFAAGDVCLVRKSDRSAYEIVTIDSISTGVSVTAESNLVFSYASGDTFRHLEYWPELVLPSGEVYDPDQAGDSYFFTFNFLENL